MVPGYGGLHGRCAGERFRRARVRRDLRAGRVRSERDPLGRAGPAAGPRGLARLDRQDRHSPPDRQDQLRPPGRQDRHSPPGRHGQPDPQAPERTALIVACGLGDDAEEVSRRGYQVTAFDLVPAAIGHCRERFPGSAVSYQVADLFRLPGGWSRAFYLVVEIRTLQSLPLAQRADAAAIIAGTVRPGGRLFVHGLGRADGDPPGSRP